MDITIDALIMELSFLLMRCKKSLRRGDISYSDYNARVASINRRIAWYRQWKPEGRVVRIDRFYDRSINTCEG